MTDTLAAGFASGRAIDIVLAFMALEALYFILFTRRRSDDVFWMLLPGALMLLAVRTALTGAGWPLVALWLILSLPAHLNDVRRRRR